jgi:hypothetical protein
MLAAVATVSADLAQCTESGERWWGAQDEGGDDRVVFWVVPLSVTATVAQTSASVSSRYSEEAPASMQPCRIAPQVSVFVLLCLVKQVTLSTCSTSCSRDSAAAAWLALMSNVSETWQLLRCQYLYFCTSKASKLSNSVPTRCLRLGP